MFPSAISSIGGIPAQNNIELSSSGTAVKSVVQGETLEATVLEKNAAGKYTLALKNIHVSATSTLPLSIGEKLTVKVGSLEPQIILHVIQDKTTDEAGIKEKLRQWMSDPKSMLQIVDKAGELKSILNRTSLPSNIVKGDIEKIIKILDSIVFSAKNKTNPLFLKDFVFQSGLLLESSLRQLIESSAKGKNDKQQENNLKALLLKLSSSLQEYSSGNLACDDGIMEEVVKISKFSNEAIRTIEVNQVLNSVFQDNENGLVLQIPVALAQGYGLADIFITQQEQNGRNSGKHKSFTAAVFLDLDILGKITVNAGIREGVFNCIIKCEEEEVKNLIDGNLTILKNALSSCGYRVEYIDCIREDDLQKKKEEFISGQFFCETKLVNFFA